MCFVAIKPPSPYPRFGLRWPLAAMSSLIWNNSSVLLCFSQFSYFEKNWPVILGRMCFTLSVSVFLLLNSSYAFLARIPEQWCYILLGAYQEAHNVGLFYISEINFDTLVKGILHCAYRGKRPLAMRKKHKKIPLFIVHYFKGALTDISYIPITEKMWTKMVGMITTMNFSLDIPNKPFNCVQHIR